MNEIGQRGISWRIPQGAREGTQRRDARPCVPGRHPRRHGARGLSGSAQAWQRAVRHPCGQGRHVLHARCVIGALARIAAPAPLRCPAFNCAALHPKRDAPEAAVRANSGLRVRTAWMGGGPQATRTYAVGVVWYGWDQNGPGIAPSMPFLWRTRGNVSQPRKNGSRSWQAHTCA